MSASLKKDIEKVYGKGGCEVSALNGKIILSLYLDDYYIDTILTESEARNIATALLQTLEHLSRGSR